jgi:PqqD family protein of HPr-rel-A system
MKASLDNTPTIPEYILWRVEDENAVLFNEETGDPFLLNETGTRIFEHCTGGHTIAEIVDTLIEEYECDKAAIQEDVLETLQELIEKKLIRIT